MSIDNLRNAVAQTEITDETVDAQFCSDWLKGQIRSLLRQYRALEAANAELVDVVEFAQTAIDHALYLGYCGEGSTKGMCETASSKLEKVITKHRGTK